jgi:hypothetical protein
VRLCRGDLRQALIECSRRGSGSAVISGNGESKIPTFFSIPEMRYQNAYVWLVFVSALDIILTALVIYVWGGDEVNPVTDHVIQEMGFVWAIIFKFAMMLVAVIVCEVIGRQSNRAGRRLAVAAVVINGVPVVFTLTLLSLAGPPAPEAPVLSTGIS